MTNQARAWAVVVLLFLFMRIDSADKALIGLSAMPFIHELHLTHTQFGTFAIGAFMLD